MNLSLFIAKRYLVSKKSHNAINIISGVSVLGICIGTMALVVVLSAFNGISDLVKSIYHSFGADLKITINEGKTFSLDSATTYLIKHTPGVIFYTDVIEENALARQDEQQCEITVRGVGKDFIGMSRFDTLVKEGEFSIYKVQEQNIVLGRGVAGLLNAGTNDVFNPLILYGPKRGLSKSSNPENDYIQMNTYVSGVFSINEEFDNAYGIISIENARKLFGYTNEVSSIELGIDKTASVDDVKQKLKKILGNKFTVKDHFEQNEVLFKVLQSEKLWVFIIMAFILIVATFNVIGSLTMLIIEKKKDIRILWDMGADVILIRRIFLFEGLMVTLVGAIVGLLLGTLICWLQIKFQFIRFNDNFVVSAYPIKMIVNDYLMIFSLVCLIGALAAWYPIKVFTNRNLVLESL